MLGADALTSEAEVRTYLDVTSDQKPETAWIEAVINGVSTEVQSFTGRLYKPSDEEGSPSVKRFGHDGGQVMEVADARNPDRVRVAANANDDDAWSELDADGWLAEPLDEQIKRQIRFASPTDLPATNQGWDALALHRSSTYTEWPREARVASSRFLVVEVRAEFGHLEVPANVQLAVKFWIQNIMKRDQAFFSREFGGGALPLPGPMPADVKQILVGEREHSPSVVAI